MPPRLLSGLARSTLPTSSLSYASAGIPIHRSTSDPDKRGESSTAWRSASPVEMDDPFPDLDPTTGLPLGSARPNPRDPSLHLQRTITDLLASPSTEPTSSILPFSIPKVTIPKVGMPSIPNLSNISVPSIPGLPSLGRLSLESENGGGSRRNFSTTNKEDDWGTWASGWWSGNKSKVDETLSKEDQADTVEEEQEKHRRKCELLTIIRSADRRSDAEESSGVLSRVVGIRLSRTSQCPWVSISSTACVV